MGQSIEKIRENTNKARELMRRTRDQHFCVGAFNVDNQDCLIAISRAAQKLNSPVLVEVTHDEVSAIGIDNIRDLVDNYKEEYGIEMYVNLDHGHDVEVAKKAIDGGFEFIHIDISQANPDASYDDIVSGTREVVEYAKKTGALVESELHGFAGSSNMHEEDIDYEEIRKSFTTPEEAISFFEATGVDTFAVAVGNLHGKYPVPKILDLQLLARIRGAIDPNALISLHGGSGTPMHFFTDAAKIGVSKVNINSDMRYAYRTTLEKVLADNPDQFAVVKIMEPVRQAVQEVVEEKIAGFGSTGMAVLS
jgi:fructose-bisphosphate aldolase class II